MSDVGYPCYFGQKGRFRGLIFFVYDSPKKPTLGLLHNIGFPKADGLSIQKLHSQSIFLFVLLNFPNPVPGQPTIGTWDYHRLQLL